MTEKTSLRAVGPVTNERVRFTKGPWRIADSGNICNRIEGKTSKCAHDGDDGYRTVASFQSACDSYLAADQDANALANARLIAAAPDLDNGCGALLGLIELILNRSDLTPELRDVLTTNHRIDEARAARAKARGE